MPRGSVYFSGTARRREGSCRAALPMRVAWLEFAFVLKLAAKIEHETGIHSQGHCSIRRERWSVLNLEPTQHVVSRSLALPLAHLNHLNSGSHGLQNAPGCGFEPRPRPADLRSALRFGTGPVRHGRIFS